MSIDVRKCFGQSLKKIRQGNNLTQEKLAELSDLDSNSLSSLELGKTLGISSLQKLCNGLGIHPKFFFQPHEIDEDMTIKEIKSSINAKMEDYSKEELKLLFRLACSIRENDFPKIKK